MKHLLTKAIAGSGLLLMALTASAQYPPYQDRDRREAAEQDRLFDRLRSDLERARASTIPFTADRDRVIRALERVNTCDHMVASGDYDRDTFNAALSAVQQVIDMNRLSEDGRGFLMDDMRELHRLQARLEY